MTHATRLSLILDDIGYQAIGRFFNITVRVVFKLSSVMLNSSNREEKDDQISSWSGGGIVLGMI